MSQALHKKPDVPFRRPAGIKLIKVNPKTGLLSKSNSKNYIIEAFKPGHTLTLDLLHTLMANKSSYIVKTSPKESVATRGFLNLPKAAAVPA